MKKNQLLKFSLVSLLITTAHVKAESSTEYAESLADKYIIVDTHIDTPIRLFYNWVDIGERSKVGEFDYPRAVQGGLDAAFMSIFIPPSIDAEGQAKSFADNLIDSVEKIVAQQPKKFQIATCVSDVHKLQNASAVALPMGIENGGPIAGKIENLRHFYKRGIRYITLAHSKWNHISDSSYDPEEHWGGLSDFGTSLVKEMNNVGVMIDVSHITDRAFWQVIALTETPVIASHSSLRYFVPGFHRNMSDEMVRAMGENGGVIQINFGSTFVTEKARNFINESRDAVEQFQKENQLNDDDPKISKYREEYMKKNNFPYARVADVADHIDRTVELAGIDHVGLGSDFDGVGPTLPTNLKHVGDYPNLIQELLKRGYSERDIQKILVGNLLRVWKEAELFASARGNPVLCAQN